MGNDEISGSLEQLISNLAGGRTVNDQIEWLRRYGNHGIPQMLKAIVLNTHGFPMPKQKAQNAVLLGCYIPFSSPFLLLDIITLLDLLNIDYTLLEHEFCCGSPVVSQCSEDQREKIMSAVKDINKKNVSLSHQKGADTLAYCCVGCSHTAKAVLPDDANSHIYIYDLIVDKLEDKTLKIEPTVIGYFEGCHTDYKANFPGISLKWERYRQILNKIEGLTVIDLPNKFCCKKAPDKTFEKAKNLKLDTILCSCNGCYGFLSQAARGSIQIMSFPEILLKSISSH